MRSLILLSFSMVLAGSATASFDLFIVPNDGENYTRFDPINRVALGSITTTVPRYAAAVASRQEGLFSYASGTNSIKWSTGERVGLATSATVPIALSDDGTRYARTNGSGITLGTFQTNGTLVSSGFYTSTFSVTSVLNYAPDRWLVYGVSSAGLQAQMINDLGQTISAVSTLVTSSTLSASTVGQATFVRTGASRNLVIPFRNATNHYLASNSWSNNGVTASIAFTQTAVGFHTTTATTTLAAVRGHLGFFLVGADQTNSTLARVVEYDEFSTFVPITQYTTNAFSPVLDQRWQMANIVAPEPGTMTFAMGAGLVAILRRRKKA